MFHLEAVSLQYDQLMKILLFKTWREWQDKILQTDQSLLLVRLEQMMFPMY